MGLYAEMAKVNAESTRVDKQVDGLWAKIEESREKIRKLETGIERNKTRMNKVKRPHFTDALFAIKDELESISGMKCKMTRNTFGLDCTTYIQLTDKDGKILYMTVSPGRDENDNTFLRYNTGERTVEYPVDSIGELNGFNNVKAPLPDTAAEIFELMKSRGSCKE